MTSVAGRPALSPLLAPERILVVKLADFGDALLTTPALRALRETYPGASLDVLTTPAASAVYRHCGLADEVLTFEKGRYDSVAGLAAGPLAPVALGRRLRSRGYDTVVLLHHLTTRYGALKHAALVVSTGARTRVGLARSGGARGWFLTHRAPDPGFGAAHEVEAGLSIARAAGASTSNHALAFEPGGAASAEAVRLLEGIAGSPVVAIHPGSGPYSAARRWPSARFARVAAELSSDGAQVVLVGRASDDTATVREACGSTLLDLTDRTSLPVLAAVLARMHLLVCNDSGVMHLATAAGTPVVAVFGPTSAAAWGPWWPGKHRDGLPGSTPHRTVSLDLPCRPCLYVRYALGSRFGCPTRDCVSWLSADAVLSAARESLAERRL